MLVPSRNVIPSWTPRVWARSSRRSQTPRRAQRRKVWAARDHGPSSAGMARHLAPFSCRQTIADSVRRRSFGCVLPWGRHASTNGSKLIPCASDSIALSSFQEGQNARHHNRFKREQALVLLAMADLLRACANPPRNSRATGEQRSRGGTGRAQPRTSGRGGYSARARDHAKRIRQGRVTVALL